MIKRKSFTLIELIVCLAIISVMIFVIRVNFINNKKTMALEELKIIAESIENAKVFSIENKKIVVIKTNSNDNTFDIKSEGYFFKKIYCKNLNILNSIQLDFNNRGIPSEGKTFKFSYDKEFYEIRVRPVTGFINVIINEK